MSAVILNPLMAKKGIGGSKSRALVAVGERVVLGKALPPGGHLDHVRVVACLGVKQRRFEKV